MIRQIGYKLIMFIPMAILILLVGAAVALLSIVAKKERSCHTKSA